MFTSWSTRRNIKKKILSKAQPHGEDRKQGLAGDKKNREFRKTRHICENHHVETDPIYTKFSRSWIFRTRLPMGIPIEAGH
jgi:hypothetical protein